MVAWSLLSFSTPLTVMNRSALRRTKLLITSLSGVLAITVSSALAHNTSDATSIVPGDLEYIVGGATASDAEFPFLVQVYPGGNLCGGSLISDSWVVTAAHCTVGLSASSISVRAGSNILDSGGQLIQVAEKIEHPAYNSGTYDNDIALLRLQTPVTNTNTGNINWLANNESALMPEGASVVTAGWGTTSSGGNVSSELLKVTVEMSYHNSCAAESDYSNSGYTITENMICAGVPAGGKDACQGDSGGPLILYHEGRPKLAGIVSWGIGCAEANYPGVYTRVANYADWIATESGIANGGTDISSGDGSCQIASKSERTGTEFVTDVSTGCDADTAPALDAAALFWADFLYSTVPIKVFAEFDALECGNGGAVLGAAAPWGFLKGPSLPEDDTWYSLAQANSLVGADLTPSSPDIYMVFNSEIGSPGCTTSTWYFDDGSAPTTPEGTIDLYGTVQHEIGHGLGFLSRLGADGSKRNGFDDIYSRWLYHEGVGLLKDMTDDADRAAAIVSDTNLTWAGSAVDGLASSLITGTTNGNVRMFAPSNQSSGSSVSHFDTSLNPKELMEPFKAAREDTNFLLTKNLFRDLGWMTIPDAPSITAISAGPSYLDVSVGAPYHLGNTLLITYTATCGNRSASGTGTVIRVNNLSPQTTYRCQLTVTTAAGESDPSAVVEKTTTPAQPPGSATIDSVETYGDEASFKISLTSGSSIEVDRYIVTCTAPNSATVSGESTNSNVTVSGLTEGVAYTCSAFAENVVGPGGATTASVTVDGVMPGLPIWLLYQATQSP